jgi:hypothetical protein
LEWSGVALAQPLQPASLWPRHAVENFLARIKRYRRTVIRDENQRTMIPVSCYPPPPPAGSRLASEDRP